MYLERSETIFIGRFARLTRLARNLGIVHGFSTRKGGVSQSPFDSLNLGPNSGDDADDVLANRACFFGAMGLPADRLAIPQQVHGDRIRRVSEPGVYPDTDAVITNTPGVVLTVQVADCVPVWLVDPARRAVGLVHAGWRGSALRIAGQAAERMAAAFGSVPSDLLAFLGPSIGPCCYEVGEEVLGRFPEAYALDGRLDLWRINEDQLVDVGLMVDHVETSGLCTACHSEWFFSHRRSGDGRTGRMMATIGLAEKP